MARKMKDSGIEWIGEIPEDWETVKLKWFANIKSGDALDKNKFIDNGNVEVYGANSKLGHYDKPNIKKKTIITGRVGTLGTLDIKENVWITDNVLAIDVYNADIKFVYYFLHILNFDELSNSTAQPLITATKLLSINIALPINIDQKKISNYLNNKTKQIENIKSTIIKEIQTLEDYKKSVITEAVTKGLDKNVEMKDSGIEWIGKIPKYWKISKIMYLSTIFNGSTPNTGKINYWDGDVKWVTPKDLFNNKIITDSLKKITEEGYRSCGTNMVPINTILLSTRAPIGTVAIAKTELCTNQGIKSIVCNGKKLHYKFLFYYLQTKDEILNFLGNGTTFMELSTSSLMNLPIPYTDIEEQNKIVDYLDQKTKSIDEAIEGKQKQLEILEEYKKSLIYEYVTGKKEVGEC